MLRTMLFIFICFGSMPAFSAWYINQPHIDSPRNELDDSEYSFKLENIACTVSETQFHRMSDDQIIEARNLSCDLGNDTNVYVAGKCNLPDYELIQLNITRGETLYSPMIICAPNGNITAR